MTGIVDQRSVEFTDSASFLLKCISEGQYATAFSSLDLLDHNSHAKKLHIFESRSDNYTKRHMFSRLHQCCPEVEELDISASTETICQAMNSFPNITSIECSSSNRDAPLYIPSFEVASYPKIESFKGFCNNQNSGLVQLIRACPNLRSLDCRSELIYHGLSNILISCSKIRCLSLDGAPHHDLFDDIDPILSAIADYGLQVQELLMKFPRTGVDIRSNSSARRDMRSILKRLRSFELEIGFFIIDEGDDPESPICSMFGSSGVDLQHLSFRTYDENAEAIALMLQRCRNIEQLKLRGEKDINPVMMKISANCHQLVDLILDYRGQVEGPAIQNLLQSCQQLKSLTLRAYLNVQAYENLVIYGGNLLKIKLASKDDEVPDSMYLSFPASSPLNNPSFKQIRKFPVTILDFESVALDVKSLVKFLSCFGLIEHLSVRLDSPQLLAELDDDDNMPIYHAHQVSVKPPQSETSDSFDAAFLAYELMSIAERFICRISCANF
jgi:hypothetical protein